MKLLVALALIAVASADVSHLNLPSKDYLPPVSGLSSVSSVAQLPLANSGVLPSSEYLPPVQQTYHHTSPVYLPPVVSTHYSSVPAVSTHYTHQAAVQVPHYTTTHYTAPQYQTYQQYAVPQYHGAQYDSSYYQGAQYQHPQYQSFQQYTAPGVSSFQPEPVPAHTFGADGYSYKDPRY